MHCIEEYRASRLSSFEYSGNWEIMGALVAASRLHLLRCDVGWGRIVTSRKSWC